MPRKQQFSHLPIKKTSQQNEKLKYQDKFIGVTSTPLIQEQYIKVCKRMNKLTQTLFRYSCVWAQSSPSQVVCLRNYLQHYYQYYQLDQFDTQYETLPSLDVNLYTVSNAQKIYKSYNIFDGCQFPIRFNSKFVSKATTYSDNQIKYMLGFIMLLAQGHFYGRGWVKSNINKSGQYGFVVPINTKSFPYNRFFYMKIYREKNLLFNVGVEKKPIVRNGIIKRYEYTQYIQILDVLTDMVTENPNKLEETVQRFKQFIMLDVAKKDHGEELVIDDKSKSKKVKIQHLFEEYENPYMETNEIFATQFDRQKSYNYKQIIFKPTYVSMGDISSLIFDKTLKRWVPNDYVSNLQLRILNQYQRKVNEELIKRFVDFQSAKTLVQLLTKIPNFRVQLTQQEKDVIGENGNVLVIGRSGTGKTTCAVLRLFAIQMLFKIRLSLSKKKHQQKLKDTRCSADDIDKTLGLHCVFLTASPVLTNQIERYYKKLTENIKTQLQKKKKRQQQQRQKQQQQQSMKKKERVHEEQSQKFVQISQEQQIKQKQGPEELEVPEKLEIKKSQEVMEEQQEMNKQLGGIQLQEKIENQKFEEDEQNFDEMKDKLEQKLKKFKSLADLKQQDYPGFFTVKSFIMMIDGTLAKPFFIRKNQNNEEESQATWHNEKKGVMMIENYYRNDQEQSKEEVHEDQIEEEINYEDQQELEHEYLRQIQLRQNKQKQKLTDKLKKSKKSLSFEVDYDYFLTYFWPNVRHKQYSARNITPHLVWTQIYSTIKGSAAAHQYPGYYLSQKVYIATSSNAFLTKQQKLDVYETFCQYERWKYSNGGYDMMDAVNYILNFFRFRGYTGPQIHYVMIDEVQDLPHSIVYLLSKTVRYGVFYSGDTAQTIAKGIGFRFCDLKNLFDSKQFDYSLELKKPVVKQLTVNFRSHNNILQLANSVVSSIQILFPKTIDRLNKQVSNLTGPKPIILPEGQQDLLFYVLCGDEGYKRTAENTEGFKKPPLQFGCDQVIIVRDQQSKNKIPTLLQHALCLTIYEAKGLQFNDVILFNFFSESKCADKWNLLKFLKVVINEIDAEQYQKSITKHIKEKERKQKQREKEKQEGKIQQKIEEPEQVDVQCIVDRKDNKVQVKKLVSDAKIVMKDINDYAELCSELKMLYTAITRPKNTLIIYDQDSTARKTIEKIWEKLEVVQLISHQLLEESNKKHKPETQEIKIFKSIVNSTDSKEWKRQGLKMYSRGYFEQAMKCFSKSGNQQLYKKAQANNIADLATKKLIQVQSERQAIASKLAQYQKMNESDLSRLKKKLKKDEAQTFINFQQAGKIFESLLMFKQAGQCYFSGKKYQNAYENFSKAFMNKQAAESLQMLNKYREAAEHYQKQGLYLKVIQCLDMINQWQLILKIIQKFSSQMSQIQRKSLLKKYSALALQQLVYEIQFENQPEQNKPENNRVEVIKQEDDSQQQDWDSDEDPEVAAERSLSKKSKDQNFASRKLSNLSEDQGIARKISAVLSEPMRKQSLIEEDKVIKQSVYENVEAERDEQKKQKAEEQASKDQNSSKMDQSSFADLNQSNQQSRQEQQQSSNQPDPTTQSIYEPITQQPVQPTVPVVQALITEQKSEQNSFAELNQSQSSFSDLNSYHSNQFNVKYPAQLEPDIESIRSLADPEDPWIQSALSEIPANTNTQYSIIDEEESYNTNVRIIKTKGNIVVQDQIMKKIVSIVSIVNQSVQQFFRQFKGYQSLITISNSNNDEQADNRPEISQFQDIDPKFINIILDTLQSFKLYKLCLFVCNRYHLPHKAGRYLISMALKYSTNAQINNNLNPALIAPSVNRKNQLEKGILASIALHAMFENVSPDFLKVKVGSVESKNSLGSYFIEGLILEGLYKKAVFMVNPEQSLKILKNFCDNITYQTVFSQKFLKKSQPKFLTETPKLKTLEQQYTMIKLQQMLNNFVAVHKFDTVSQRYFKQFDIAEAKNKLQTVKSQNISYVPLLQALFTQNYEDIAKILKGETGKFMQILNNGPNYKIYQIVTFLTASVRHQPTYSSIFSLPHTQFLQLLQALRTIRLTLHKQHHKNSFLIIQSIFSVFNCRILEPCQSMRFINDGYSLIHRTSTICNQFVEELKKNANQIACFFQQDYNYILVKTSKLLDNIRKKFQQGYGRFLRTRIEYVGDFGSGFLYQDFLEEQSQYLLKSLLRQQLKVMYPKQRKVRKQKSTVSKKSSRPAFNYKTQGRPQLVVDLQSSQQQSDENHQEEKKTKFEITNFFIYPDLNEEFKNFSDLAIHAFYDRLGNNNGKMISGRLMYSSGINDSYKEFCKKRRNNYLYDALQFRKFWRLDLYADNLLSVINQMSYGQRQILSAEVLIHLLVQYKCMTNKGSFKLDIPRRFLKFFPSLTLLQTISNPEHPSQSSINQHLHDRQHVCVFSYENKYSSEFQQKQQISDLMCEFFDILKAEESYKCFNIQKFILIFVLNLPHDKKIGQAVQDFIDAAGSEWNHPILLKLRGAPNYDEFIKVREKVMADALLLKNSQILHEVRVKDISDIDKAINESQIDYQIKQKILQGRAKAVAKISAWWRIVKKKGKPGDQNQILKENRVVKMTHNVRYLPQDDRFLLRSSIIRDSLLSFYLRNIVVSSLDFHFILMTLNKIEDLRKAYIKAYSMYGLGMVEMQDKETDFEQEIAGIESTVNIWRSDEKWIKDRNLDLRKKKVFEVKWMTKSNIHKIVKKRAGLHKQKRLEDKKKILKKLQL